MHRRYLWGGQCSQCHYVSHRFYASACLLFLVPCTPISKYCEMEFQKVYPNDWCYATIVFPSSQHQLVHDVLCAPIFCVLLSLVLSQILFYIFHIWCAQTFYYSIANLNKYILISAPLKAINSRLETLIFKFNLIEQIR